MLIQLGLWWSTWEAFRIPSRLYAKVRVSNVTKPTALSSSGILLLLSFFFNINFFFYLNKNKDSTKNKSFSVICLLLTDASTLTTMGNIPFFVLCADPWPFSMRAGRCALALSCQSHHVLRINWTLSLLAWNPWILEYLHRRHLRHHLHHQ